MNPTPPPPETPEIFGYLEALADSVARGGRPARPIPVSMAEGAATLVRAAASAVYLLDKKQTQLLPEWVSAGFPALIPLPKELAAQSAAKGPEHPTVVSFLKLSPAPVGEGPLGRCAREEMPQVYGQTATHGPLLLTPLRFGARALGVLAVARRPETAPFSAEEIALFQGLATQCGVALGTALMQADASEKSRMESELRSAREVQRLLLPESDPELAGFDIAGKNLAARIVSGDYYDFIPVDAGHLGLVIADVSGKGIPASLVMATCRGLMRGLARREVSPSAALSQVNRSIFEDMKEDMFISAAYVMLQPEDSRVTMSRAGHDAPLLYRQATRSVARLEPPGLALGVDDGDVFDRVTQDYEFHMEPGDCLLLYTDGVNEAENTQGVEFGMARLEATFGLAAPLGAKAVISAIQVAISAHMGKHPQSDDVTMVAIQRR